MTTLPTLYTFRRCPYAMRARMALKLSGQSVSIRELILRDKPAEMLAASPKGSVPVLILPNGAVIDESLDLMRWALAQNDPFGILPPEPHAQETAELITQNDGPFKHHLDRYKYPSRYEGVDRDDHQKAGAEILTSLDAQLTRHGQLFGDTPTLADIALFPFIRQFRIADADWFDAQPWGALHPWLSGHIHSSLFTSIMPKFPLWKDTGEEPRLDGPPIPPFTAQEENI